MARPTTINDLPPLVTDLIWGFVEGEHNKGALVAAMPNTFSTDEQKAALQFYTNLSQRIDTLADYILNVSKNVYTIPDRVVIALKNMFRLTGDYYTIIVVLNKFDTSTDDLLEQMIVTTDKEQKAILTVIDRRPTFNNQSPKIQKTITNEKKDVTNILKNFIVPDEKTKITYNFYTGNDFKRLTRFGNALNEVRSKLPGEMVGSAKKPFKSIKKWVKTSRTITLSKKGARPQAVYKNIETGELRIRKMRTIKGVKKGVYVKF